MIPARVQEELLRVVSVELCAALGKNPAGGRSWGSSRKQPHPQRHQTTKLQGDN